MTIAEALREAIREEMRRDEALFEEHLIPFVKGSAFPEDLLQRQSILDLVEARHPLLHHDMPTQQLDTEDPQGHRHRSHCHFPENDFYYFDSCKSYKFYLLKPY
mgnify:CR=1 FL=1